MNWFLTIACAAGFFTFIVWAVEVRREQRHEQQMWLDIMDRLHRGEYDTDGETR